MKIKIRKFEKKDVRECLGIIKKSLGKTDAKKAKKDFFTGLDRKKYGRTCRYLERFIVELNNKVVGISGLYDNKKNPNEFIGIGWFAVDPRYQGRGIGAKMLKETIKRAKKLKKIYLFVWSDKSAVKYYKRFEFKLSRKVIRPVQGNILLAKKLI